MRNKTAFIIISLFIISLFSLSLFSHLATADVLTYVSGPSIRISMISQDPDPVKPGEYVEL
ncbi:hypothetical protein JXC34_05915, partial [Candidatus Woesearchaeota archaeon]|nr:hypothetical protein [Candidatus Woesearchaeota archaeon]